MPPQILQKIQKKGAKNHNLNKTDYSHLIDKQDAAMNQSTGDTDNIIEILNDLLDQARNE